MDLPVLGIPSGVRLFGRRQSRCSSEGLLSHRAGDNNNNNIIIIKKNNNNNNIIMIIIIIINIIILN